MGTKDILLTVLGVALVVLVLVLVWNEEKIANWEQEIFCKIKRKVNIKRKK